MKINRPVVIVLIMCAVAAVIMFAFWRLTPDAALEESLPSGALAVIRLREGRKTFDEIRESRLWKNIRDVDWQEMMRKSGVPEERITALQESLGRLESRFSSVLLDQLFGKDVALAFYVSDDILPWPQNEKEWREAFRTRIRILVVTDLKKQGGFLEFLSRSLHSKKVLPLTVHDYSGQSITEVIMDEGERLYYLVSGARLHISNNLETLKESADITRRGGQGSLREDPSYQSVAGYLPGDFRGLAFFDLKDFLARTKNIFLSFPVLTDKELRRERIEEVFRRMSGLDAVGFASVPGRVAFDKIVVSFDEENLDPVLEDVYSCPRKHNRSLDMIPRDVLAYQWNACTAWPAAWKRFKDQAEASGEDEPAALPGRLGYAILRELERDWRVDPEKDIVSSIGDESGSYLADIEVEGLFPVPKALLFIEVSDEERVRAFIGRAVEHVPFLLQEETYGDTTIRFLSLPFGFGLKPGYGFYEHYLMLTTDWTLIKDSIDAHRGKRPSLKDNKDFQKVNKGLSEENKAVLFARPGDLVSRARDIVEWGYNWFSLQSLQIETYRRGIARELRDIEGKISELNEELNDLVSLKEGGVTWHPGQPPAADAGPQESDTRDIDDEIEEIRKKTRAALEEKQNLEAEAGKLFKQEKGLSSGRYYLDEVLFPVLEGFQVNKVLGSRTVIKDGRLETMTYTLIEE